MTTQFDPEQKAKLTQIINEGMGVMSEVEALNEGLSDTVKSIAEELQISKRTTEVHRFNLMKKMDAKNLQELTSKAQEYQLV